MAKRRTDQLHTAEINEKRKQAMQSRAKKGRIMKLIGSLKTLELAPIDEELAGLKAKIAELEATRAIVLKIRGAGTETEQPTERTADHPAEEKPRDLSNNPGANIANKIISKSQLAEKLYRHLKTVAPQTIGELADYFGTDRVLLMDVLNNDRRFEMGSRGWILRD